MPASTVTETRTGRFSVVQMDLPGQGAVNLGILLQDPSADVLHLRFRRDLESLCEEESDLLEALSDDLDAKARAGGAEKLFEYLEGTLSASIRVTDRETILVEDFGRALDRLYRQHVASTVLPFRTHLPRYSLRVAAGKFLDNQEVTELDWMEMPENLRLVPDMFVAEIVGHSMEPKIPDGSMCVFRAEVTGSRQGRLVLVENREDNSFTVKRYVSEKAGGDEWRHKRIRLEALNPDYESWDLDPEEDKYRIFAEFVCVLV